MRKFRKAALHIWMVGATTAVQYICLMYSYGEACGIIDALMQEMRRRISICPPSYRNPEKMYKLLSILRDVDKKFNKL